jgi:Tol biopolymer transport system component
MNRADQLERELTAWLHETAAPRTPDFMDDVLRQTAARGQRPGWTFPERWIPMSVITLARRTLSPIPMRTVGVLIVLALLLLATAFAVFVGSRTTLPPPLGPAGNGIVAFGSDGDIVTVDPLSGVQRTLVGGSSVDNDPLFSPDGTRITVVRAAGMKRLMLVDVKGGEPIDLLKREVEGIFGLTWAPDSRRVAFSNGDLWVVQADGSGGAPLRMNVRSEGFPLWRPPSGDDIVFTGYRSGVRGLFLVHVADGSVDQLTTSTGDDIQPAMWTLDGRRIVTTTLVKAVGGGDERRIQVLTVGADGRLSAQKTVGPPIDDRLTGYGLSPDGTRFAASTRDPAHPTQSRVAIVAIDGGGAPDLIGPSLDGTSYAFSWLPDGRSVALNDTNARKTWILDIAGGGVREGHWSDVSGEMPSWQRVAR